MHVKADNANECIGYIENGHEYLYKHYSIVFIPPPFIIKTGGDGGLLQPDMIEIILWIERISYDWHQGGA